MLLGLITDRMALWLMIVLGGILAWHFVNLFRLQRWLRHRAHEDPPDIGGVWGDVIAVINRIYRRKQFHRARVTALLREFRRMTTAMPEGAVLLGPELRHPVECPDAALGPAGKAADSDPVAAWAAVSDPKEAADSGRAVAWAAALAGKRAARVAAPAAIVAVECRPAVPRERACRRASIS